MDAEQVVRAFEGVRRAQHEGRYAPHKPLLLLLALARLQRGEPRLVRLTAVEDKLRSLLAEFGPTSSVKTPHYPFWHLRTDDDGALWTMEGPRELLDRAPASTPGLKELRQESVAAGFSPEIHRALTNTPGLIQQVARHVLDAFFPETLHADIAAEVGLDLDPAVQQPIAETVVRRRRRDPAFRERVLRAYEFRCCVCGFDLRIGHLPAGLEAAHIHWHISGGPDIEPNGLSLCALHHKLFDLGAFTIEPTQYRVVFSQHAISGDRGMTGVLARHGQPLLASQDRSYLPGPQFLEWNLGNVFKAPRRAVG